MGIPGRTGIPMQQVSLSKNFRKEITGFFYLARLLSLCTFLYTLNTINFTTLSFFYFFFPWFFVFFVFFLFLFCFALFCFFFFYGFEENTYTFILA